jgi:hypothetical protein
VYIRRRQRSQLPLSGADPQTRCIPGRGSLAVEFLQREFGASVPRTRQGSLVGRVHHRDKRELMVESKEIEAGCKSAQCRF